MFYVNLNADNMSSKPNVSGVVNFQAFELSSLNSLANYSIMALIELDRVKSEQVRSLNDDRR